MLVNQVAGIWQYRNSTRVRHEYCALKIKLADLGACTLKLVSFASRPLTHPACPPSSPTLMNIPSHL